MTTQLALTDDDRATIARRGLAEAMFHRQLELCRKPSSALELVAPATPDDGIVVLSEEVCRFATLSTRC